ncbi:DUF4272 domain-containing protein [Nocardia rhamnosiphila]
MTLSTQDRLKQHGLEVDSLPEIEEIFPIRLRDPDELARRTLALHALLGIIFYPDPREVSEWMRTENFLQELTEREKWAFSLTELPEEEMRWQQTAMQTNLLTWRAESLYVLLWAAGRVPSLVGPSERMDGSLVADHLPILGRPLQPFIREAGLRPTREILAELHYYFFLNHFMEDIYEQTGEIVGDLDPMLTAERFQALHWIACADQSEWDGDEE